MNMVKRLSGAILFLLAVPVFVWRHGEITYATLCYVAFTIGWLVIRERLTRGQTLKTVTANVDGLEKATLFATAIGMMLLPVIALYTPLLDFALYTPTMAAFVAGTVATALGAYVFFRAHADLGAYWSPTLEIRDGHQLITSGIYSRVRHPMYTAIFLICIGQALLLENWLAGIAGLIAFTALYVLRVGREEKLMIEQFGETYQAYAARTPRLIPSLRTRS
ncbi:protein-S-isoprenylcysteine O-methyltransferase [Oceaniradius stylonematis]|uniref:protein-S-isoprenylcysteine O-methyltransferase n=1 Tax=Oceaniradius stylonematis TaxID=2184161 RepID=UPI00273EEDD3|nr:protein-S-isoprenylcysteine O-methyltransferase [Oceaniradius stylonematis]